MADQKASDPKSLEMRLAAIEDKLAKLHITEEEMKTYEKVASLMGGGTGDTGLAQAGGSGSQLAIPRSRFVCISRFRQIVRFCYECQECGPCGGLGQGGGFSGGGGFGGFGT